MSIIEDIKKQVKKGRKLHAAYFVKTCPTCNGNGRIECNIEEATDLQYAGNTIWEDEYQKIYKANP